MTRPARVSLLAAVLLAACGEDFGPRVPAAIVVTPAAPRVAPADTLRLTAAVVDAAGAPIDGHTVRFRSSDESVLTVDDAGLLTSVGSTGTTRITAASGNITAEVEAAVALPPSSVVVSPRSVTLNPVEQTSLAVIVTDANAQLVPGAPFTFESSDPAVVRVEPSQFLPDYIDVIAIGVGTAMVTVTSGSLSTDVPVTVKRIPFRALVTPTSLVLSPGGSEQATARLIDRAGGEMDLGQPFTWSSSNEAVITVSQSGMVSAVGPEGSAIITATVDTFTARLGVFVGTPPAGEKLAKVEVDPATGAAVISDGRYFVSSYGSFVGGQLPDFSFPFQVALPGQAANEVVVNPAGTRAYLIGISPGLAVVDLATQAVVDSIQVHMGGEFNGSLSGALSADGSILTVGTHLGFEVIDVATKASLGGAAVGQVIKVTHHPTRPLLYASGTAGVLELDDRSGAIIRRFTAPDVLGHVVSPDGAWLYAVTFSSVGILVWNLETGAPEPNRSNIAGTDVAISPDGRFLYSIYGAFDAQNTLTILDAASGAVLREVVLGGLARRVVMAPDGTAIITNETQEAGVPGWVDFVR